MLLQVEAAGARVEAELGRILGLCDTHIASGPPGAASRAVAVYDCINNGVWVKLQGRNGRKVPVSSCMQSGSWGMPCHGPPLTAPCVLSRLRRGQVFSLVKRCGS